MTTDTESMSRAQLTALLMQALDTLEAEDRGDGVMSTAQNQLASLMQSAVAQNAVAEGKLVEGPRGQMEAKFDGHDLAGWLGTAWHMLVGARRFDFLDAPDEPEPLPEKARVGLLADWGSGLYGAPVSAESIEKDGQFDVLVHLGDVYYSGTGNEVEERFLKVWPKVPQAVSRACNGNHEMYTGGHAYAGSILPAFGQSASYFAMQNEHWLLVGLDTAYLDHDLFGEQVAWLDRLLERAGDRGVVLMSHHQPYSVLGSGGHRLVAQLGHLLDGGRIHAWYWGHEHWCILYNPSLWNMHGRCIGHGGFPEFRAKHMGEDVPDRPQWKPMRPKNLVPGGRILDGPNEYIEGEERKYFPHGYAVLELEGDTLVEAIYDAGGVVLHRDVVG